MAIERLARRRAGMPAVQHVQTHETTACPCAGHGDAMPMHPHTRVGTPTLRYATADV